MSRTKQQIINSITSSIYSNGAEEITGDKLQTVLTGMVADLADQNTVNGLTQSVSQLSTSVTSISEWIETSGSQGGDVSIDGYTYKGIANTSYNPETGSSSIFYIASEPGTYTRFGNKTVGQNEVVIFKRTGNSQWDKDITGAASKTVVDQLTESVASISNWISENPGGGGGSGSINGYVYKTVVPSLSYNPVTDSKIFYIASIPGTYSNFIGPSGALVVGDNEVAILKNNGMEWVKESTGAIRTASGGGGTGSSVDTLTTAKLYNYQPGHYMTWKGSDGVTTSSSQAYIETDNVTVLGSGAYQGNASIKGISRYPITNLTGSDLSYCFKDCSNLKFVPYFKSSGTTNMSHMFESCSKLTDVDHPYDTLDVIDTSYMFAGCNDLETVHLGDFSSSTNMSHMFENCYSLREFTFSGSSTGASGQDAYDLFSLTNSSYMFANCYNMTYAPAMRRAHASGGMIIPSYSAHVTTNSTGEVTGVSYSYSPWVSLNSSDKIDASHMFENCYSLKRTSIPTSPVSYSLVWPGTTNISYMFTSCSSLESTHLFQWGFVTASEHIFDGCYHLRDVEGFLGLKSNLDLSSTEQLTDRSVKNIFSSVGSVSVVGHDDISKPTLKLSDQTWLDHVGTALDRFDKAPTATVTLLNKNWRLENSAGGFVGPVTTISNWDDIHIPSGATSSTIPVSGN